MTLVLANILEDNRLTGQCFLSQVKVLTRTLPSISQGMYLRKYTRVRLVHRMHLERNDPVDQEVWCVVPPESLPGRS